jgi:hypothetical protein
MKEKDIYKCVGDDDAGMYLIGKDGNLLFDFIRIGNPDIKSQFLLYKGRKRWVHSKVVNCL